MKKRIIEHIAYFPGPQPSAVFRRRNKPVPRRYRVTEASARRLVGAVERAALRIYPGESGWFAYRWEVKR